MSKILSGFTPQIILNKLNAKMTHPFMDFRTHENTLTFPWRILSPDVPGGTRVPRGSGTEGSWGPGWTRGSLDVTPL